MIEAIGSFFDSRLEIYDEHQLSAIDGAREFYPLTAETVIRKPGARILDLGPGTGLELEWYFRLNPTARVTGIDLGEKMLGRLREKFPDKALRLIVGSYFDVPFTDGENGDLYDGAVSVESLHHFSAAEKTALYRKLRRALKPGGTFVLTDYFAASDREEASLRDGLLRARAEEHLDPGVIYHVDTPLTVEHELGCLAAAGFGPIEVVGRWPSTAVIRAVAPSDCEKTLAR